MKLHFTHWLRILASIGLALYVWSGGVLSSLVVWGFIIAIVLMIVLDVHRYFRQRDNQSARI